MYTDQREKFLTCLEAGIDVDWKDVEFRERVIGSEFMIEVDGGGVLKGCDGVVKVVEIWKGCEGMCRGQIRQSVEAVGMIDGVEIVMLNVDEDGKLAS